MQQNIGGSTTWDDRLALVGKVFDYLKRNALGQPSGAWLDRKSGSEEPGIYAPPENEMLISQSSGYWKKPLATYLEFTAKNPGASVSKIMKGTGLDRYHVETLAETVGMAKAPVTDLNKFRSLKNVNERIDAFRERIVPADLDALKKGERAVRKELFKNEMPRPGKLGDDFMGMAEKFRKDPAALKAEISRVEKELAALAVRKEKWPGERKLLMDGKQDLLESLRKL